MNEPTHGVLFVTAVLLLIGFLSGAYVGFTIGVFWDGWMKKAVRRGVEWAVNRWYDWRGAP